MSLDIKLEQTKDMLCFESALASIAIWWNRRYEMIFSQSWNFDFKWQKSVADSELIVDRGDMTGLLKQYHGINTFTPSLSSSFDTLTIIEAELALGRPVYTEIISSSIPWFTTKDQEINFASPFLILGLEASHTIICLDIHYLKKTAPLPITNFLQGCITLSTFKLDEEENGGFDWHNAVAFSIEQFSYSETSPFAKMRCFADFLASASLNEKLLTYPGYQDFGNIPVLNKISRIGPSRMIYALALKYMAQSCSCNELMEIYERLVYQSNQWYNIRSILTKEFYAGKLNDKTLSRVSAKVHEAAEFEETTSKILTRLYMDKPTQTPPTIIQKKEVQHQPIKDNSLTQNEIIYIDINQYCNNKAFSNNEENISNADFTGLGEFFLTEGLPSGQILHSNQMQFKFIDPTVSKFDNISCSGQVITVPAGCYESVMLLGCSEWGSYSGNIEALYESEVRASVKVEFADWFTEHPPSSQILAWQGICIDSKAIFDKYRSRFIYAECCPININSFINSLCLPNCPNIHLFALSLLK